MGTLTFWICAAIAFGLMSGSLYTWLAEGNSRKRTLWIRTTLIYTALALAAVAVAFRIAS